MTVSSFITLINISDGGKGDPGLTPIPTLQYALISETAEPTAETIWSAEVPSPWYLGLEYWSRMRYSWSDGTTTYSTVRKCTDMNALMLSTAVFEVSYSPTSFERNLRDRSEVSIRFSASFKSYQNGSVSWLINGETFSGEAAVLSFRKDNAPKAVSATVVLSYVRAGVSASLAKSFEIKSIDTTEYSRCLGVFSVSPSAESAIDGDCHVLKSGPDFIPMVLENGNWVQLTPENEEQYPEAMSKCGNAVILAGGDIPKTSRALYAYFASLFAKSANLDFISTQDIQIRENGVIRSTGKTAVGDGKSGFIIKSDGTSEFVGAVIRNADLSETRIERLDADVLRTVNATLSGEQYSGMLDDTPFWNLGAAVSAAMGKSSRNAVTHKNGSLHVTHAEGDEIDTDFSAVLYVTDETERTKPRPLLSCGVDASSQGTAFTVPALPEKVQSAIRLGGTGYHAVISETGASCAGTKQYSFDGGDWTDYDSIEFSHEAVRGKTIRLRQVLTGSLPDVSGCESSQISSCSADTMYPRSATGNGRMVIGNCGKLISFPIANPASVTVKTLESAYNSVYGIAFGNGVFLAVAVGSVQGRLLSGGTDGISWTVLSQEKYNNLFFADGFFHAHKSGTGADGWVRSANGSLWEADSFRSKDPYGANNSHSNSSFCFGNGMYLQVCYLQLTATAIYRSTDGVNWNSVTPGASNLGAVAYGNGLFIAHEMDSPSFFVSGDGGVTWAKRTHSRTPRHITALTESDSAFYGADSDGKLYRFPIVNGTPTAVTAGTLTAEYSFGGYESSLNLLDATGRKLTVLSTAESYYTGVFSYNGENMVSELASHYKFGGIFKGTTQVASGSFDMFSALSAAWTRIYSSTDSYGKTPAVITWSGTSVTIINTDNTNARIRSNDLFSELTIAFRVISEAKGAYTKDMYPQESGVYNIGSATKKYDQIHANQLNGRLVGDVNGNLNGDSSGTHTGNVNAPGTQHKVYGAVWAD